MGGERHHGKQEVASGGSSAALDGIQCAVLWALSGRTLGCGDGSLR